MARPSSPDKPGSPSALQPAVRALISVLVTVHLAGVFTAALWQSVAVAYDVFPMPARERMYGSLPAEPRTGPGGLPAEAIRIPVSVDQDPAAEQLTAGQGPDPRPWLLRWMAPYLDQLFMGGGYNFFAPDPGESLVIHYTVEMDNGEEIHGKLPDLDAQWPRLRYHRYFMITSQALRFRANNAEAYARYLLALHGGRRIHLFLKQHILLRPEEALDNKDPNAESQFRILREFATTREEMEAPAVEEVLP
jgi:hypothetical protein